MEKAFRLRKNEDFQRVYRQGKPAFNRDFKILGLKKKEDQVRFGFSLTKKFGKAYQRNRMKRRLKEIVRLHLDLFPSHYDYVIIPRDHTQDLDYAQLTKSLFHCFDRWKRKNIPASAVDSGRSKP